MTKKEPTEAREIVDSFFRDVLANFFVIIFMTVLMVLWITIT